MFQESFSCVRFKMEPDAERNNNEYEMVNSADVSKLSEEQEKVRLAHDSTSSASWDHQLRGKIDDGECCIEFPGSDSDEFDEAKHEVVNSVILKYTVLIMRVFGLFHRRSDRPILKAYCGLVLLLLWLNAAKFFWVYHQNETISAKFVLKIVFHIWYFIVAINATVFFINQEAPSREIQLVRRFNLMYKDYKNPSVVMRSGKKRVSVMTFVGVILGVFNIFAMAGSFFGPAYLRAGFILFLSPYHESEWALESIGYRLFIMVATSYTTVGFSLTVCYFACHCTLLVTLFRDFNESFEKFIQSNVLVSKSSLNRKPRRNATRLTRRNNQHNKKREVCGDDFELYRQWHLRLCSIADSLNTCYKQFTGFTLLTYVPIAFLLLFVMSDWNGNCVVGLLQILFPVWLVCSCAILSFVIFSAASVNNSAHGSLKSIFNISTLDYSNSLTFKMNLMVSRLTSDQIGVTTCNMFVIDKGFFISVACTIITYFFVVLQFRTSSTSAGQDCV